MPDPVVMMFAFIGAAVVAGLIIVTGHLLSKNGLAATGVVAAGAGFLLGAWILGIKPTFPPREDLDRLLLILLPITIGAEVGAVLLFRWPWAGWALRASVALMAGRILLDGTVYITDVAGPGTREWSPTYETLVLGGLAIALLFAWRLLTARKEGDASRWTIALLFMAISLGGVVIMLSGYATAGQLSVPLAGSLVGGLVLARSREVPGLIGVGLVGLFALLMLGRFFGNLTTMNAALLFAGPLAATLLQRVMATKFKPWQRGTLQLAVGAVPLVMALILAQQKFAQDAGTTASAGATKESSVDDYMSFGK